MMVCPSGREDLQCLGMPRCARTTLPAELNHSLELIIAQPIER
jgi:hypothetical protein